MADAISSVDAYVLAGGRGTRIKSVLGDIPKILAPIRGTPFLDLLLLRLQAQGLHRIILGLGVGAEAVKAHLNGAGRINLQIETVIEPHPLGTAGALRHAAANFQSDPVLVMNGDTICDADLDAMLIQHRRENAYITVACAHVERTDRFGSILLDSDGSIKTFHEKSTTATTSLVNAGLYMFSKEALRALVDTDAMSLESDFMPRAFDHRVRPFILKDTFFDFGIPEAYSQVS